MLLLNNYSGDAIVSDSMEWLGSPGHAVIQGTFDADELKIVWVGGGHSVEVATVAAAGIESFEAPPGRIYVAYSGANAAAGLSVDVYDRQFS